MAWRAHAALTELATAAFQPALTLLEAARDAYDARPRRDRDACSNAFDAMEAVAKVKNGMPTATFGAVVAQVERAGTFHPDVIASLRAINTLRNHHFGHGMTAPFGLRPHEVDFVYLSCVAGMLLFGRTP